MKHFSQRKSSAPVSQEERSKMSSVIAVAEVFAAPPKDKNTRGAGTDEGPKHHNPFKGMKI